jgi:hypothetical protein
MISDGPAPTHDRAKEHCSIDAAGYIDFEHFGRRIAKLNNKFDLALIPQRWLRDLLWDHLADLLRSVNCPRSRRTFFVIRVAVQELGALLEAQAPAAGRHRFARVVSPS